METIKKWAIPLIIAAVAMGCWYFFGPKRETIKTFEDKTAIAKLNVQISQLISQISEYKKKLTEAIDVAKNVNTETEYYPDGKIKAKRVIDLTKITKKKDSEEQGTGATAISTGGTIASVGSETGHKGSETVINPIPLLELNLAYISNISLQAQLGLNLFDRGQVFALVQKPLLSAEIYYGFGLGVKFP